MCSNKLVKQCLHFTRRLTDSVKRTGIYKNSFTSISLHTDTT